jgi:hypothetical protein
MRSCPFGGSEPPKLHLRTGCAVVRRCRRPNKSIDGLRRRPASTRRSCGPTSRSRNRRSRRPPRKLRWPTSPTLRASPTYARSGNRRTFGSFLIGKPRQWRPRIAHHDGIHGPGRFRAGRSSAVRASERQSVRASERQTESLTLYSLRPYLARARGAPIDALQRRSQDPGNRPRFAGFHGAVRVGVRVGSERIL